MGVLSFLSPIQSNVTAILGGALALSLVGNVGLGWYANHETKIAASAVVAIKDVNKTATIHKDVVENRNVNLTNTVQSDVATAIASDVGKLRSQSRIIYLPAVAATSKGIDGPSTATVIPTEPDQPSSTGTSEPVLSDQEEHDREVCVTNTDLVKGWQEFYKGLLTIQKEESIGTTTSTSNSGSSTKP